MLDHVSNPSTMVPIIPTFSLEEQVYLARVARFTITKGLHGEAIPEPSLLPEPITDAVAQARGVYVTLLRHKRLRGALGIYKNAPPLHLGVGRMAFAAAFGDRRFTPLDMAEWTDMEIEISIIGDAVPCTSIDQIVLGQHGILLETNGHTSFLLPQMAIEQLWDVPTFVQSLYGKIGIMWDASQGFLSPLKYFSTQTFIVPSIERP